VPNPFTEKSWSPYLVGLGIGILSWFAFATANKHLAITLQYEHIAAMTQMALAPEVVESNRYYVVRAESGLEPKIGWYMMLLVGVFFGARNFSSDPLALAFRSKQSQALCRSVHRRGSHGFRRAGCRGMH
jgi:hypothetical protein